MSWRLLKGLNRHLPKNPLGDYLYGLALFYKSHGRLPSKTKGYNDRLFRVKTGASIRNPLRSFTSDKELLKVFVQGVLGPDFIVPTLKVLKSLEQARAYSFPEHCCIKPTHMSGEVILRTGETPIDWEKLAGWFEASYYLHTREANYKYLQPKIIVEPLIFGTTDLNEYKFLCYKGIPRLVQVDTKRFVDHRRTYYDVNWVEQSFRFGQPAHGGSLPRPANFSEMLKAATALAEYFDYIRVDLYSDGESIQVGELTNCPCNCTSRFQPLEAEELVGRWVFDQEAPRSLVDDKGAMIEAETGQHLTCN